MILEGSKFTGIVQEGPKLKKITVLESAGQTSHHGTWQRQLKIKTVHLVITLTHSQGPLTKGKRAWENADKHCQWSLGGSEETKLTIVDFLFLSLLGCKTINCYKSENVDTFLHLLTQDRDIGSKWTGPDYHGRQDKSKYILINLIKIYS